MHACSSGLLLSSSAHTPRKPVALYLNFKSPSANWSLERELAHERKRRSMQRTVTAACGCMLFDGSAWYAFSTSASMRIAGHGQQ